MRTLWCISSGGVHRIISSAASKFSVLHGEKSNQSSIGSIFPPQIVALTFAMFLSFFGYPLPVVVIIREQRPQGCRIFLPKSMVHDPAELVYRSVVY
jgi:hypothetical protein